MGKKKSAKPSNIPVDPMAITWGERHSDKLEYVWGKLPTFLGQALVVFLVFLLGISIKGDWLMIYVHIAKQLGYMPNETVGFSWENIVESLKLRNFLSFFFPAVVVSYVLYFGIGGFLHWYFYVRQKDRPEEWKCQPKKWMSPELETHEILFGSLTLFINSTVSAMMACYIANGGYSKVYYHVSDYGWPWFFLQFPVIFISQDYAIYWMHRIYHTPFLYKNFHKLHHKYKQPTAFSVTAIHPVEAVHIQLTSSVLLFLIPLHWFSFYAVAMYVYYHGIIDHSGIDIKAYWWQPWQPDVIFHDNHHQYFHVNFGFNILLWDKIHGTYRQKDRVYREDIFYGKGKSVQELSKTELQLELEERASENPNAHRNKEADFDLSRKELKVDINNNKIGNGITNKNKKSKVTNNSLAAKANKMKSK